MDMNKAIDFDLVQLRVFNIGGDINLSIYGEMPAGIKGQFNPGVWFRHHKFELGWSASLLHKNWSGVLWSQKQ